VADNASLFRRSFAGNKQFRLPSSFLAARLCKARQLPQKMHLYVAWMGIALPDGTVLGMAERVGFEALNAVPCTALHGLGWTQETKHLSKCRLPPDFIDVF
jgi:hypothetical protein